MNRKYYQMKDVCNILDIPASTIRFWEENFPQIKPLRSSGGHRTFDHVQLERLKQIKKLLKDEGLTIEGAKKRLTVEKPGRKNFQTDIVSASEETSGLRNTGNLRDETLIKKVRDELKEILFILKRTG
jgi:DNA-binding transcriptional MerR regulator